MQKREFKYEFPFFKYYFDTAPAIPIIFVPGLGVATWLSYLLGIPYKAMAFSLCVGQVIPGILGVIIIKILSSKIKEI